MLELLCLAATLVAALFAHFYPSGITRHGKRLPRPPGTLPLAGYGIWFLRPRHVLLRWFAEIQPRMGFETYEIPVPSLPPAVLINDPKNLEYVLKENDLFVKGDFFRSRSRDLFADGILNADGELWRIQRKAGLRFLSNSNVKSFIDDLLPAMFETTAGHLNAAAEAGTVIDLQQELLDLTTRFFGKVAYDMDISPSMPFSQSFDFASAATNARFTNPFWRIHTHFFGHRFRQACEDVHEFGASMVNSAEQAEVIASFLNKPAPPPNLITSLLAHIPDRTTVAAAATNYLSAGRDTTAQTLTWTFYSLLSSPEALQQLLSSLESAFPNTSSPLNLNFASLAPTPSAPLLLVHAVYAEGLRLNPAVPFELKETTAAAVLPDCTVLPSGAAVLWVPYAMARNPLIWGEDAARFRPGRWIEKDDDGRDILVQKSAFENPVFNAGPRMCVGKKLAESLGVWVLTRMLCGWQFEVVGKGEKVVGESLTAPMRGGLSVRVIKRRA